MSYAVGIALCAVGILLGLLLARRLGPKPSGAAAEQERMRLLETARTEYDTVIDLTEVGSRSGVA